MNPIVKWAGGKKQLVARLTDRMPRMYKNYYEPFIGGGAMLFALSPHDAHINDINSELIHMYKTVRDNCEELIMTLNKIDQDHEIEPKTYYYSRRDLFNQKIISKEYDIEMAALFIYLNKHCFNGLYRVNKKGLFNVPFNNRVIGKSFDEHNLKEISKYFQDVVINNGDFSEILNTAGKDDFVFFDSPYDLINDTSFESYTKSGFPLEEHIRLADIFKELTTKGVLCMLTNHNTHLINELYKDFNIEVVTVRRSINSDATKRKGEEVIITNYPQISNEENS